MASVPTQPLSAQQPASRPPQQPSQRSIRPLLFVMLALCVIFVSSYLGRLSQLSALNQQIQETKTQIEQAKVQQDALHLSAMRTQSEDALDEAARRDLDLLKPGDQPFHVLPSPEVPLEATPANSEAIPAALPSQAIPLASPNTFDPPIWKQWLELFDIHAKA